VAETLPDLTADAELVARAALAEDGPRDLTTDVTVPRSALGSAAVELRETGVAAGLHYAETLARLTGCAVRWDVSEGDEVAPRRIGTLEGTLAGLLRAERPFLNLLQRAGGIASATRTCVHAVAGTHCRVLHTRKTAPGLRLFDAAAVVAGGGGLHRLSLAATVLVKDNHWAALRESGGTLRDALARARREGALECQVEVESEAQVEEACSAGADRLLIDNRPPDVVHAWAERARALRAGVWIEASGGITPANVRAYAEAGADFVSLGMLTHSVRAPDIALKIIEGAGQAPRQTREAGTPPR
jgi:nicotinate-nucleotide pyrophosphorylase (carboxylating)